MPHDLGDRSEEKIMNDNNATYWSSTRVLRSSDANVTKYVFERRNAVAEAVLYRYPTYADRTVICCSTQSGCPIGCRFCGAGDLFVRSLTADEIVSQPTRLLADTGVDPKEMGRLQIMFMSMGEPLLVPALIPALRRLHASYPNAALLISTSGPKVDLQPVIDISVEIPTVGLQFSVHESTDEARGKLIPFAKKMTLQEIAHAGLSWARATGRRPFFNYCAHDGNTSHEDAQRIFRLFNPAVWQATISVVCERDESVAAANARQRKLAIDFMEKLIHYGYSARCFDPAGQDDIGGGCGQLWFVQDWMREHPTLARPSIGRGIAVVHAPRDVA
jgi:23S rRNA (adenine2503-C2)-methyltransferase